MDRRCVSCHDQLFVRPIRRSTVWRKTRGLRICPWRGVMLRQPDLSHQPLLHCGTGLPGTTKLLCWQVPLLRMPGGRLCNTRLSGEWLSNGTLSRAERVHYSVQRKYVSSHDTSRDSDHLQSRCRPASGRNYPSLAGEVVFPRQTSYDIETGRLLPGAGGLFLIHPFLDSRNWSAIEKRSRIPYDAPLAIHLFKTQALDRGWDESSTGVH